VADTCLAMKTMRQVGSPTVPMQELSSVLWRERELLDMLLFKLEEEQLLLAAGRTRWLPHAAREVEAILENVREAELLRAVVADAAAEELGLSSNPSLRVLAEAADEPWRTILMDHRDAFAAVAAQVRELADSNKELLTTGAQAAQATLLSMSDGADGPGTYGADGSTVNERRIHLLDRSI
jgi:flagellar biosynthesis/type III secretory pathway chaperone